MTNKKHYQIEVVPVGRVRTREFFDSVVETARKYSMEKISFRDLRLPANSFSKNSPVNQPVSSVYFVFPEKRKARKFMEELVGNRGVDEIWIRELKI